MACSKLKVTLILAQGPPEGPLVLQDAGPRGGVALRRSRVAAADAFRSGGRPEPHLELHHPLQRPCRQQWEPGPPYPPPHRARPRRPRRRRGSRPLSELLDAAAGNGTKFVSYQVHQCTSAKTKGILNLSYKVGKKIPAPAPAPPSAYPHPSGVPMSDQPVMAYDPYGAQPAGYPGYQPPPHGYAPRSYQAGFGYPPAGYLYAPTLPVVQPPKNNEFALKMAAAVLLGLLTHIPIGDMIPDAGAFDDVARFDF
ncbi:hypothetical protein COCNU_16G003290 [Cocos nucifera]|uniref:Uncharacterized protein n=1 Tax=Cocos nucifera TaxID=13894 RepID=A0A8K0IY98_COCNU|nr:hypothetical protein COCNU_16G003290 [Cocos nucifera]